jgi:catechol 2,3-dioxygenase
VTIDPSAHIDSVHLTVPDLGKSIPFYQDRLGLRLQRHDDTTAAFGAGGPDLLVLHASSSAPRVQGTTGLYHFALLVPSRPDLARTLKHLAQTRTVMQGFADHFVSEAIYLADPDGNGIEIYRDRPRAEWPMMDGVLKMGSDPLDIESLLAEAGSTEWDGLPDGTRMGHVHLHVSRISETERFYVEGLGLDLIARFGKSASFLSAGGYHHHVGANTWAGVGAPPPPPGALGLKHVVLRVTNAAAVRAVGDSLGRAGFAFEATGNSLTVQDPSGNTFEVRA